jgi:Zn-dependent membrane protease YugP
MFTLIGIAALVVSSMIQGWLRSIYSKWMRVANTAGLTGAQVARTILDANGLHQVKVERVGGMLSDHYDPRSQTVRLSEGNFSYANIAGMAVAAHEVGHAIQHSKAYGPLTFRTLLLPVASIGSRFGPLIAIFGLAMGGTQSPLLPVGLLLFTVAVLFQIVTLPVEFDASHRALSELERLNIATNSDVTASRQVLNAAAMTYVAAAATSAVYLLYYASFIFRRR